MNRWTEAAITYLEARRDAGDRAARALLARSDAPRRPVKKEPIESVEIQKKRARAFELEEELAIRMMHDDVWRWNVFHSDGRCDCGCGYLFRTKQEGELDHWKGRRGPGAHTRANGWRLRRECHEKKDGRRPIPPDEPLFNARRRAYCERAGIPFVPRKELER
jgi:5-methylcytosine-specific restriction endonuclease McrA